MTFKYIEGKHFKADNILKINPSSAQVIFDEVTYKQWSDKECLCR